MARAEFPEGAGRFHRGTCDGCGKVRKLAHPPNGPAPDRSVFQSIEKRRENDRLQIQYYGLCVECYPKVKTQGDIVRLRQERPRKPRQPRFSYPCVGGPLDGQYALTTDFYSSGKHHGKGYAEYNQAGGGRNRVGSSPSMIFVHESKLLPLRSGRDAQ